MKSINKSLSYSAEFRESVAKLAVESDQPLAATARDVGVNVNTLYTWTKKYLAVEPDLFSPGDNVIDDVDVSSVDVKIDSSGCASCKFGKRDRIRRYFWMRLLPGSKFYECSHCYERYLKWSRYTIRV